MTAGERLDRVVGTTDGVRTALDAAVEHLRGRQHEDGWWKGLLATNVTMDAEDLMLRTFLGIATPGTNEETARWIRSRQRVDGSWATFHGGPGDLSTTVEAWVALRLAGDQPEARHMRHAAEFAKREGGVERARVFTHIWLALFGLWSWDDCPALPPELMYLLRHGRRSTSTTGVAGLGRQSCRSPSSAPSSPCIRWISASPS